MLKDTLEFHQGSLEDFGFQITEDSKVKKLTIKSVKGKAQASYVPVKAGGKDLVLPTKEWLDEDGEETIIYHPLQENVLKGESFTITTIKNQANTILRARFLSTLCALSEIIATEGEQKHSPKLTKLINQNPDYDGKAHTALVKMLKYVKSSTPTRHLLGIYLHSTDATYEGKPVRRLAHVSSALRDELGRDGKEVWGVAYTVKAKKAIAQLIDTILPDVNNDAYSHGSNNKTAPYFDCVANAFLNISYQLDAIDSVTKRVNELLPKPKYGWVDGLSNLAKLSVPVPPLEGNLGNDVVGQVAFDVKGSGPKISETAAPKSTATPVATEVKSASESTHPLFGGSQQVAPQSNPMPQHTMPTSSPMPKSQPTNNNSHPLFQNSQPTGGMPGASTGGGMPGGQQASGWF